MTVHTVSDIALVKSSYGRGYRVKLFSLVIFDDSALQKLYSFVYCDFSTILIVEMKESLMLSALLKWIGRHKECITSLCSLDSKSYALIIFLLWFPNSLGAMRSLYIVKKVIVFEGYLTPYVRIVDIQCQRGCLCRRGLYDSSEHNSEP